MTAKRWKSQGESLQLSVLPLTRPLSLLLLIDPSPLDGHLFVGLAVPVGRQTDPGPPPLVVMGNARVRCRNRLCSPLSPYVMSGGIDLVRSICFLRSLLLWQEVFANLRVWSVGEGGGAV